MSSSEKSLKSLNIKWLVGLALLDVFVVLLFIAPELTSGASNVQLVIGRIAASGVLPVLVILLTGVLPHDLKAVLVYGKIKNVLPGCQAFTRYGPKDPRVNMASLKTNVGALPTEPADQNAKWYGLYKLVRNDAAVIEAHKMYLLYRDMAAMSLILAVAAPAGLYPAGVGPSALWTTAAFFVGQYVGTALAARWSGIRFVCNVLALHSTSKITAAKPLAS